MIGVFGFGGFGVVDTNGTVIGAGDKLITGGREVDVHHRRDMIGVSHNSLAEVAHIELVTVVILVRDNKVVRLHGIPGQSVGLELKEEFVQGSARADIIQGNGTVGCATGQNVGFGLVELDSVDGVGAPFEGLDGFGSGDERWTRRSYLLTSHRSMTEPEVANRGSERWWSTPLTISQVLRRSLRKGTLPLVSVGRLEINES